MLLYSAQNSLDIFLSYQSSLCLYSSMHNDVMSNFGHKKSFPDIKTECLNCVRENDALTGPTPGILSKK